MAPDDDYYRSLIEQAVDGNFVADASGRYVDVNEAGARLLGMTRDEVLNRTIADVIADDEQIHLPDVLARIFAGETVIREWRFRRKDGSVFFGEVAGKLLADGRVHGLLRDVTQRKRGEIALRQSEERFRLLTDAAFEGIAITEDGRVVEINDQLAGMLGYARNEMIGLEVSQMIAPQSRDIVRNAIENERARAYEHIALRKDGTQIPVEVRGKMVELAGRRLRMTAVRDISERRRMEDALQSMVVATATIGQQFFRSLVRETASALGVRCALVAELRGEPEVIKTIAACADGAPITPLEQPLAGSACGELVNNRMILCDGDAQERFPADQLLQRVNASSLLGVALLNTNGAQIGVLLALHDRPLAQPAFARSILSIFASRAAAELERMRSDAALRASEENIRATIDTTPHVAIQWYDLDGRIERWNPASERMFGWGAAEALGKTLDQLIHPPDVAAAFRATLREIERSGAPVGPVEYAFRRRDGSVGTCLSTTFRIPGSAHGGARFVCMDVDVSEHKRTEEALRESAERYRLLVENSSDLVCELDGQGKLLYVSQRFESVLGFSSAELLGQDLLSLVHPDDTEKLALQFARGDSTVTFRSRHKQGEVHWLEATRRSYRSSAGDQLSVVIARDISDRRRAEQQKAELEAQLRQTQKLESLGTLAGGIAHDFNNILGAIFAYSELATLDAERPQRVRTCLAELDKAARRARDLVQQILSFSRAQRQERSPVALPDMLDETLRFLRSTLPSTIDIDVRLSRETPMVLASPVQVHQVMLNLCMNAAQAMREGPGKLTVLLEPVMLDAEATAGLPELQPGKYARLSVRDTGHGMDEATRKRVFEPFFTTKPIGEGTGLGLAVTHGIVRDHQGAMRVISAPGKGATFMVYLPAHEWSTPATRSEAAAELPVARGERVLFVDDEPALCASSRMLLEHVGYRVTTHRDPLGALNEFEQRPGDFDVVVTDLTMPGITGVELGRQLLRIRPDIPIVLVSGFGGGWTLEQARAVGLRDLLQKPLSPQALMSAVQRAMYTAL